MLKEYIAARKRQNKKRYEANDNFYNKLGIKNGENDIKLEK